MGPSAAPLRVVSAVIVALAAAVSLVRLSAGAALLLGIGVAVTLGNPWAARTRPLAKKALAASVVGLGAGMNLRVVASVGLHGFGYTLVGIAFALAAGSFLGRRLGVARDASLLVTVGTAVCGGSAIAAIAPTIDAKESDVSLALGTVFLLNAIALFVFPSLGRAVGLSEEQFGVWAALAIHDTSSVVGAASQYGDRALEVATSAKLARALWIVPLTFASAAWRRRTNPGLGHREKALLPWFIAGFLFVAALGTFIPALRPAGHLVASLARHVMNATLFLIGLGLSRDSLRAVGVRPLIQGVSLWFVLASGTLGAILLGWIR